MSGIIAIIQARMGSSRFPGKSLSEIGGRSILSIMMAQLSHCRHVDRTILAIPDSERDDPLAEHALARNWELHRGPEDDVLGRFYQAARNANALPETGIVRLTGDDILPDPRLIDAVVLMYQSFNGQFDYVCTDKAGRLPYGAGIEMMSFKALETAFREATSAHDREHVVPYVKWNPDRFPSLELSTSLDLSGAVSLSIDTEEDLKRNADLIDILEREHSQPYHLHQILEAAAKLPK